jgi:hypothetical protein
MNSSSAVKFALPSGVSPIAPDANPVKRLELMSAITKMANDSTPASVTVPANLTGLMTWAIGKLGVGAIFLYMVYILHAENVNQNERILRMLEIRASVDAQYSNSLLQLTQAIQDLRRK